jgi:hypothetical protein
MSLFAWLRRRRGEPTPEAEPPETTAPSAEPPAAPPQPEPVAAVPPPPSDQAPASPNDDRLVNMAAQQIARRQADAARKLLLDVVSRSPTAAPAPPDPLVVRCWDMPEFVAYSAWYKQRGGKGEVTWARPVYARAWYYLGYLSLQTGESESALGYLERGLQLEPGCARLTNEKGQALIKLRRFREAAALFDGVARRDGWAAPHDRAVALRGLGYVQIELGDLAGAEAAYRKSLEWEPDNTLAANQIAHIRRLTGGQPVPTSPGPPPTTAPVGNGPQTAPTVRPTPAAAPPAAPPTSSGTSPGHPPTAAPVGNGPPTAPTVRPTPATAPPAAPPTSGGLTANDLVFMAGQPSGPYRSGPAAGGYAACDHVFAGGGNTAPATPVAAPPPAAPSPPPPSVPVAAPPRIAPTAPPVRSVPIAAPVQAPAVAPTPPPVAAPARPAPAAPPPQAAPAKTAVPAPPAKTCPQCRAAGAVPIVYGTPTPDLLRLASQQRVQVAGGMIGLLGGQAPNWHCPHCRHQWRGQPYGGGGGDGPEQAVQLREVTDPAIGRRFEMHYLTERFGLDRDLGGNPDGWRLVGRAPVRVAGRWFETATILLRDGTRRTITFDITTFSAPTS